MHELTVSEVTMMQASRATMKDSSDMTTMMRISYIVGVQL